MVHARGLVPITCSHHFTGTGSALADPFLAQESNASRDFPAGTESSLNSMVFTVGDMTTRSSTGKSKHRKIETRTPHVPEYEENVWQDRHWQCVTTLQDSELISSVTVCTGRIVAGRRDGTLSVRMSVVLLQQYYRYLFFVVAVASHSFATPFLSSLSIIVSLPDVLICICRALLSFIPLSVNNWLRASPFITCPSSNSCPSPPVFPRLAPSFLAPTGIPR